MDENVDASRQPTLSVITAAFNEEQNLPVLYEALRAALSVRSPSDRVTWLSPSKKYLIGTLTASAARHSAEALRRLAPRSAVPR